MTLKKKDTLHDNVAKEQAEWTVQLETGQVISEEKRVTFAKIIDLNRNKPKSFTDHQSFSLNGVSDSK